MNIASASLRLRSPNLKDFGDRLLETRVIVGDDELDARQAALLEAEKKPLPRGPTWRRPSPSMPSAISTAWEENDHIGRLGPPVNQDYVAITMR